MRADVGSSPRGWLSTTPRQPVAPSIACLAAIAVALSAGPAYADAFGDRDYLAAIEAFDAGRDADALRLLESALSKNLGARERDEARYFASRAALRLDQPDIALAHLKAIERAMPEIADFVVAETARAYRAARRWKDALTLWEKLATRWPDSPLIVDARYGIADALYGSSQYAKAQTAYEAALETHPRSERAPAARFNLARIAELTGRYADAAGAYSTLAYNEAGDPFSGPAAERLTAMIAKKRAPLPTFAHLLAKLDRLLGSRSLDDAKTALSVVAALAKTQGQQDLVAYRAARLAMRMRDYASAIAGFTALAKNATGWTQLEYKSWIAKCYTAADNAEAAVRAYQELADAYESRAEGREALYKAAWLAFNAGKYPSAMKLFAQFVSRYSRDRQADEAAWYLAWSTYRSGDLQGAINALSALRTKFASSTLVPRTYYWQGRILAATGRAAEARSAYRETITQAPLDYYGVLAQQRLTELDRDTRPIADANAAPLVLASLDNPAVAAVASEADATVLPRPGVLKAHPNDELPWGNVTFDYETPAGRRMLRLVALHAYDAAADVVTSLPARPGQEKADVAYARARLLYALGDYNAAYRIAAIVFRKDIAESPSAANRAYMRIAYPDAHASLVESAAAEFSVSPLLVLAIMRQESAFDDRARSWASANGLMQIIPDTANRIAKALEEDSFEDAHVTEKAINVRFGTWYLGQLMHKFHNNPVLAIASYNAGPMAVSRWVDTKYTLASDEFVEEIPFRETRGYVRRVLGNLAVYSALYGDSTLRLPDRVVKNYRSNVDF